MENITAGSLVKIIVGLTFTALAIRLMTLGIYPLMDTTEARYGEIARIMAETSNWITPQFDYNIPFWGKPPLYSWITALSFKLFGISEFSARLPHFLTGLLVLWVIWSIGKKQSGQLAAALSTLILSTTVVFLISIGAVMTDTVLMLSVVITLAAFWRAWHGSTKRGGVWGYLFFAGLGIGLLAKGPIVWILTGIPVFLWCLPQKRLITIWSKLPWITGIGLMLLLSLPWYIMAEMATPGFLDYFIVGEHFKRFLVSGWEGDLYGTAHTQPKGMIWIMWLYAAFPWNLVLSVLLWKKFRNKASVEGSPYEKPASEEANKNWRFFLWCWMLSPILLFTTAGNVIWPYVLPGIPAMALLIADYLNEHFEQKNSQEINNTGKSVNAIPWLMPSIATPAIVLLITVGAALGLSKDSAKNLVQTWQQQPDSQQSLLLFWNKKPFSGQFYSNGRAKKVTSLTELKEFQRQSSNIYLIIKNDETNRLPEALDGQINEVAKGKKRSLFNLKAPLKAKDVESRINKN